MYHILNYFSSSLSSEIEEIKDEIGGNYTNALLTAVSEIDISQILIGTDGSVGYLNNTRINSSGIYVEANCDTTGLISGTVGDTIRLKNITMYIDSSFGHGSIAFFSSDGTYITGANLMEELSSYFNAVKDSSNNIIQFTIPPYGDIGMFRITCQDINESSVITVNEEIIDTDDTRFTELETSVTALDARVTALENTDSNEDIIPSYWQTALEAGAQEINEKLCTAGMNKSAFLFYSDSHWNYGSQMSPTLLKYLYKHTGMSKTFFGGDIVNDEATDYDTMEYLWEWRKQLKDLPNHHSVVGNHDDGNSTNNLFSEQYIYGYLLAAEETSDIVHGGVTWYYIDNGAEKTRYVFLDTAYKGMTSDQQEFLKQALIGTAEGWHIVVVSHIWYLPDYNQYDVRPIPLTGLSTDASTVTAMLDAYNSRTGDYADCGATVEFCIGGHVHRDYVGATTGGIPIILVETDSMHLRSDLSYTAGTITEASVNGIVADYNTNKVNVVRVGRGSSFIVDLTTGGTEEPDTPTYTNLIPTAVDIDGTTIYNGKGFKENVRMSGSSGQFRDNTGSCCTGYMAMPSGVCCKIYLKNIVNNSNDNYGCVFNLFNGTGVAITDNFDYEALTTNQTYIDGYKPELDEDGNIVYIEVDNTSGKYTHMVVSAVTIDETSIITINEPIE